MNTEELLKILACPSCHGELKFVENGDKSGFECDNCKVIYPIQDDIPVMLIEKAIPLDKWHGDIAAE